MSGSDDNGGNAGQGAASAADGAVIERGLRLSASSLWKFQRQFYDHRGVRAWSEQVVPTHITSNAYIAQAYAHLAMRFMQDLANQAAESAFALDPEEPVYIVELGSGSGYFAYLFLNKLVELQRRIAFKAPRVCYVATDFTDSNLETWKNHSCFAPLAEYGLFDCAKFDAEEDEEIELQISGRTLSAGSIANPMLLVANYLFDTIYNDVFRINQGVLEEGLTVIRRVTPEKEPDEPNPLDQLRVEFEYRPVEGPCYGEPALDQILEEYAATLGNTAFTFPIGPLRCIERFERLSGGRMLLLSGDKGYARLPDLTGLPDPSVVHHGSISVMVNYHAISRYLEISQGGFMLATDDREASLEIVCASTASPESLPETCTGYYDVIDRFGPMDTYSLAGMKLESPDFDQLMAQARLTGYDPISFTWMCPQLQGAIKDLTSTQTMRLLRTVNEVWRLHYPLLGGRDVPFELGFVCYLAGRYTEAQHFYEQSIAHHGPHHVTYYNIGLCQYRQGQLMRALDYFERSLDLDGSYGPARDWKVRVAEELSEPPLLEQLPPESPRTNAADAGADPANEPQAPDIRE